MKRLWDTLPKEEIERLYWKREWSTFKIAKHFGVSVETVRHAMIRYGIPRRKRSQVISLINRERWGYNKPTKDGLEKLYENLTIREIAKKLGVKSFATIRNWMKEYGIKRRPAKPRGYRFPKDLRREDILLNFIIHNKEKLGYKDVYVWRTDHCDMIAIRKDGSVEKVELEISAGHFDHHHKPSPRKKVDRIITIWGEHPKIPTTKLDHREVVEFARKFERLL